MGVNISFPPRTLGSTGGLGGVVVLTKRNSMIDPTMNTRKHKRVGRSGRVVQKRVP